MQNYWMRLSRDRIFALLVLSLSLMVSPASAQTVDEIISRGKLIIAVDTTTPPYGFLGEDLKPTGFDIEVANKMGEALGRSGRVRHRDLAGPHPRAAHQAASTPSYRSSRSRRSAPSRSTIPSPMPGSRRW